MVDNDISTVDALRQLTAPEAAFADPAGRHELDRRRFLQLVGMGVGAGLVAGPGTSLLDTALSGSPTAWAAGPIGPTDGIVIVLGMLGGNDGLNTVVPIDDGLYYDQHRSLAIPPGTALPIGQGSGLHPELTVLKEFWDRGQLAIVEGVGYPNPDLSHFNSMAKWMSGRVSGIPTSGWVGRWLDGHLGGAKDLFAAAEVGHSLPLHMIGQASRATAIPASRPSFGALTDAGHLRQYQTVRSLSVSDARPWHRAVGGAFVDQLDVAKTIAPSIPVELSAVELVAKLEVAARLVNANLGFRVLSAGWGDFDSHAGQPQQHAARMRELDAAIRRFYAVLDPSWSSRVTFMTFSEFGRTSHANDGAGTDHGTSAPHFVFGANVAGGMFGQRPTLAGLERWQRMTHHVDFRDYYGSVIDGWLGGGGSDVLGRTVENLGLFAGHPGEVPTGQATPVITTPGQAGNPVPAALSDYQSLVPHRLVDTRDGLGAAARKVQAGETIVIGVAGTPGLPAGVTSVLVNVTATEAEGDTWFSLWPRDGANPGLVSSLNPGPRRDCSNYVIVAVDPVGEFLLYNNNHPTHVVLDIAGCFTATGGMQLIPLEPARLVDTREGLGAPATQLQGPAFIDLTVTGSGGVPSSAVDSVVLNVTTTDVTQSGFVQAYSTDVARPPSSNANYSRGNVIANTMICKVGADGRVRVFVNAGALDLVVDVVGYFAAAGARLQAASPRRILDTREGLGAPAQAVGPGGRVSLTVHGQGGVPSTATAVVLNVTAAEPSSDSFVTVFPGRTERKTTSSMNTMAGQTTANLVIAKIGVDGNIEFHNHAGTVHLVADVSGWFV